MTPLQFFVGGSAFNQETGAMGALVMGLDESTANIKFRKFIAGNSADAYKFGRTMGMAVSLDGSLLALHIQEIANNYSTHSVFATMRATDGGIINDTFEIVHGPTGTSEHTAFSHGMVYKDASTLFVTFM